MTETRAPSQQPPTDAELHALTTLRTGLAERAARDHTLDVAYTVIPSPVGELLLASTEAGLAKVAFLDPSAGPTRGPLRGLDQDDVLALLARQISPRILHAPARLSEAARQLDEYFAGRRTAFDLLLDLRLVSGFRRQVIEYLNQIAYGHTESYAQVAVATGSPRAVRAVGSACRVNPVPIVVPCHRVVRADGSVGEYAGGAAAKRRLLTLESSPVDGG